MEATRHIRYRTSVGKLMTFNLSWAQLISGQSRQLWMETATNLEYMREYDCMWIERIRLALQKSNSTLWVAKAWNPEGQRQHDSFLMDRLCEAGYTQAQLAHIN